MSLSPLARALETIRSKIAAASAAYGAKTGNASPPVRLVAVSKTKPLAMVLEAHTHGQRVFGENYVQELVDKAKDPQAPADIEWHFIGHLQTNKCNALADLPRLMMVETVDSARLADALNKAVAKKPRPAPLAVMVQVNTSQEESKSGIPTGECVALAEHIVKQCPSLRLAGLMTIGDPDRHVVPNPDFEALVQCRAAVAAALGVDADTLELSMGMSGDFEHAVEMGSTNVRVGSSIFGAR